MWTPKNHIEAEEPSGLETLPGWHLTAYESYVISSKCTPLDITVALSAQLIALIGGIYLQSSSLPIIKHTLFCPTTLVDVSLVNLRRAPIGARPSGELSPQLSHHEDRFCLAAARPKSGTHWLGRFPAKPYDGLIFQGSAVGGFPSTGLPRDRIITCALGILRKTPPFNVSSRDHQTVAYGRLLSRKLPSCKPLHFEC
jgi:hypothetical protein